jgi:hypothetical protein
LLPDGGYPFADYAGQVTRDRKEAVAARDEVRASFHKLLAVALYGKIAQGVSSKRPIADEVETHRVFDSETGEMIDLPPSSITSPPIAAWLTSFVRATMFEALHRLSPTAIPLQATTDGILFCGAAADVDTSGPNAQMFKRTRAMIEEKPDPPIWITKHVMPQVLTFKTRGMIPIVPDGWPHPIHLAKAGAKLPEGLEDDVASAHEAERMYRTREHGTTFLRANFIPISVQDKTGCDLVKVSMPVTLSWDYDFKNKPVEPITDVDGLISFATEPWATIEKFERHREDFEDWKRAEQRVLKTALDYRDMIEWNELRPVRKALRANVRTVLPNLAIAILVLYLRRPWRVRMPYSELAEIFSHAVGFRVTTEMIKAVHRKRDFRVPAAFSVGQGRY